MIIPRTAIGRKNNYPHQELYDTKQKKLERKTGVNLSQRKKERQTPLLPIEFFTSQTLRLF